MKQLFLFYATGVACGFGAYLGVKFAQALVGPLAVANELPPPAPAPSLNSCPCRACNAPQWRPAPAEKLREKLDELRAVEGEAQRAQTRVAELLKVYDSQAIDAPAPPPPAEG